MPHSIKIIDFTFIIFVRELEHKIGKIFSILKLIVSNRANFSDTFVKISQIIIFAANIMLENKKTTRSTVTNTQFSYFYSQWKNILFL